MDLPGDVEETGIEFVRENLVSVSQSWIQTFLTRLLSFNRSLLNERLDYKRHFLSSHLFLYPIKEHNLLIVFTSTQTTLFNKIPKYCRISHSVKERVWLGTVLRLQELVSVKEIICICMLRHMLSRPCQIIQIPLVISHRFRHEF